MSLNDVTAQSRAGRVATIVVVAVSCIWFAPPLGIDGRFSHLEYSLATLALVSVIAVLGGGIALGRLIVPMPAVLLLGLMAASTLWAFDRPQAVRDVVTFTAIFLSALVLVHAARLRTLAVGVAASGAILLVWIVAILIIDPVSAVSANGALIGPYGNRNGLAYGLLTAAAAAISVPVGSVLQRSLKWLFVAALGGAIFATTSRTALVTFLAALVVLACLALFRRSRVWGTVLLATTVAGIVAALVALSAVLDLLGKGSSINGRIPIWNAVVPLIFEHPLTGQGWTMAWPMASPASGDARWKLGGVTVYHAHNELLNWLVTLGLLGGVLFVAVYALIAWGGWLLARSPDREVPRDWLLVGFAVFLIRGVTDISETLPQGWFVVAMLVTAAGIVVRSSTSPKVSRWISPSAPVGAPRAVSEPVELKG